MRPRLEITQVESATDLAAVRVLLLEYGSTPGWTACFASFETELADLPGDCRPPLGRLLLARLGEELAGCIALRPLGGGAVELRRLFVRPGLRGMGLGRRLVERVLDEARVIGHARVYLHTLPAMAAAHALYRSLGFRPVPPYVPVPVDGAVFLGLELGGAAD